VWAFQGLTVAVIGAGKIGSVIVSSLVGRASRVIATGRRDETLKRASSLGAEATRDNVWAAREADVIILSVKPVNAPEVLRQLSPHVSGKTVISVMAGVKLSTLMSALPGATVFRAMPNMNAYVRGSATAVADWEGYGRDERALVEEILGLLGTVYWVPEEWLDAWTALVGSGPAYLAEIVDGLALGAVSTGLPRSVAYKAILETIKYTAELLLKSLDKHPAALRDEVTTPAGTTIEGLKAMEERGVKAALIAVVEAATRRSRELGERIDESVRRRLNGAGQGGNTP
jgi:pyrroline-5-carboxylate reductase